MHQLYLSLNISAISLMFRHPPEALNLTQKRYVPRALIQESFLSLTTFPTIFLVQHSTRFFKYLAQLTPCLCRLSSPNGFHSSRYYRIVAFTTSSRAFFHGLLLYRFWRSLVIQPTYLLPCLTCRLRDPCCLSTRLSFH